MALSGMTGFGRAEGAHGPVSWVWEAKSVNGRGLDVRFRAPSGFEALEPIAREAAKARFARGSIQLNLNLTRDPSAVEPKLNTARLEPLLAALQPYVDAGRMAPPAADGLLSVRGVLDVDDGLDDPEAREALEAALAASLNEAFDALAAARAEEGRALAGVLKALVDEIGALAVHARNTAGARPDAIRDKIRAQFQELLDGDLPEERLAVEAAALAVKADVREELDRLDAHVVSAHELLTADGPAGRKLDFLTQEFMRESNTLCSKSGDLALTNTGLALKAVVDRLREQVQNVE
jgi:uncharacterized protein (TIGR00255 family)